MGEDNKEILWFSKDLNSKLLMKANGQSVQFQDAKGGIVAYLSDLDGFITKSYADKAYEGKFEVINATLTLNTEDEDGTLQLEATPSGEPYLLNINSTYSTYHVLMAKTSQGSYLGITHDGESIILVLTAENSGLYLRYRTNRFLPVFSTETNGKFLSVVDNTPTWSNIPESGSSVTIRRW